MEDSFFAALSCVPVMIMIATPLFSYPLAYKYKLWIVQLYNAFKDDCWCLSPTLFTHCTI